MAYNSLPLVSPSTLILKLKLHCTRCEKKLKSLLLNVQGVQSVVIDSKQGTVMIKGTVDPDTIITMLGIVGRKAEVLLDNNNNNNDQNFQIIERSKVVDHHHFNDPYIVNQLQQLSGGIKGLKNIEVTYSKTIRLTLEGHQINDSGDKDVEITIRDDVVHGPHISCPNNNGLCSASASCCGGGHVAADRNFGGICPIHGVGHPYWVSTDGCGCVPIRRPQPWPGYVSPSAPPVGLGYDSPQAFPRTSPPSPPPAPVMGYSFSSFLSDDNPAGGCNII
ncbi:hypothetical protein M9H77_11063 [Catharanthus roseus]|uniref:Uncharacterized protein n=1 Tax=Catharanthus roseus TaxID=4058 RepID=A0ACC0BDF9_CATRO|nr:hypothetical protein M9H77_11063 [Catharanthus roseus]